MGNGVVVQVKACVRCFTDTDLDPLEGGKGMVGQGEQPGALFIEHLTHGPVGVARTRTLGGNALTPLLGLRIEVVQ